MSKQRLHAQLLAHLREREERAEFLANASQLMITTSKLACAELDVEGTLACVARLALPHPGVWSILELCDGDTTRRVAVAHPDPRQQVLARALIEEWPPSRAVFGDHARVMRSGTSETIANVSDEVLADAAESPKQLELLRELRIGSTLIVRVGSKHAPIGSLTFVGPLGGHAFDDRDRVLAEDIAVGAAIAIANARGAATQAQARESARVGDMERVAFMSSLAHTFRTPLHSIYGFAQLLDGDLHGPLTGPQRADVQRIQANERHLLSLVDAVISFAKWDGAESIQLEDVAVRAALRITDNAVMSAAALQGVVYRPHLNVIAADIVVRAERIRLHEILLQLMLNAVKFSRPGDTLSVRAMVVGKRVWIRVVDTGIGIADHDAALVFQPFVRARDAYARSQPGVGLGLAVAQKLARAMDGELTVASQPGRGSTFTLSLARGRLPDRITAAAATLDTSEAQHGALR